MADANYTNVGTKRIWKAGTQTATVQGIVNTMPNIVVYEPGDTIALSAADAAAQGDRVEAQ